MTENEAIEIIKKDACNNRCIPQLCNDGCMYGDTKCAFSMAIKALEEVQQYRQIGTVEECRMAAEKQTEKKPTAVLGIFGGTDYECKNCGNNVHYGDEYCRWCGQKFDWSDAE